jgi:uncharacterized linocin/CFP29 family protein
MASAYENAAKYMDKQMVDPLRQQLIGRKLFAKVTGPLGPGKFNIDTNSLSDMGEAIITYDLPDESGLTKDSVKVSTETLKLAVIPKAYQIPRGQFEAFASQGIALDAASMISAAQKVGEREDDLLIQGWNPDGTNYKISGLYQSAGNSYGTSKDFGTAGNPTIAVTAALAELATDKVIGTNFNLSLHPTQYAELLSSRHTNGFREFPEIMEILNPNPGAPKGQVFQTTDLTAGTGMVTPVDAAGVYMDLVIGVDYRNQLAQPKFDISPIDGLTYVIVAPRIKKVDAICTMTAI